MISSKLSAKLAIAAACFASAAAPVVMVAFAPGAGAAQVSQQAPKGEMHLSLVRLSPEEAAGAHVDSVNWYHIVNGDLQCLDADSNHWGQNGDNVQLWGCNNNGEQLWTISGKQIRNYDGQCLDADSNHWGQNGDNVQLWACSNNGEQSWTRGTSHIVNADGQCLDADSNHWGQNGDNVQLWGCNNNGEQNWPTS